MNTSLDRLTDAEIARALQRFTDRRPRVRIIQRAPGCTIGGVECRGTCGRHALIDGEHTVLLWWNGDIGCDCVAERGLCFHCAGLIDHEGGALPPAPTQPYVMVFGTGQLSDADALAIAQSPEWPPIDRSYLPTPQCRELCAAAPAALFADGGNGHSGSCPHRDDEAQRLPNPYTLAASMVAPR